MARFYMASKFILFSEVSLYSIILLKLSEDEICWVTLVTSYNQGKPATDGVQVLQHVIASGIGLVDSYH